MGYQLGLDEEGNYDSDKGVETLAKYTEMFGLGETTGLEIPESEPQISDEYSVQSAIGQGTNNLQSASSTAMLPLSPTRERSTNFHFVEDNGSGRKDHQELRTDCGQYDR